MFEKYFSSESRCSADFEACDPTAGRKQHFEGQSGQFGRRNGPAEACVGTTAAEQQHQHHKLKKKKQ